MADRRTSLQFDALQIEGALLLPDVVAKIASEEAGGSTAESYGIPPGLKLRDEIGRSYQIGRALWQRFEMGKGGKNADLAYRQFGKDILTNVLGFRFDDGKSKLPATGYELLSAKHGRVPVAIAGMHGLDRAETVAVVGGSSVRRSPTTAVQGELNSSDRALWGIASDGAHLRILRDSASLTRPALIEFDLDRIFRTDLYSDFTLFWLLAHESRFGSEEAPPSDCALEAWREQGREQGVAIRGRLRNNVEEALFELGSGALEHPNNGELRRRLHAAADPLSKDEFFRQLLRLVYRLIFVMTAEDRDILFSPNASDASKATYLTGYSLTRLREKARLKSAWDRHYDTYEGVKAVFRSLASGQARLGLPALGGLFEAKQTPDLDLATIANKRFLRALFHLAWLREPTGLVRINWRDMATEEFGSVYESLLELTPVISDDARSFHFQNGVGDPNSGSKKAAVQGNKRKKTGSYYTPDSLVELLLDITLDPEIERIVAQNPGHPDALLKLTAIDPACGSGHFILGAARRIARRLADLRNPGASSIAEYRHALRDVVGHCIYGVDRNDMAVELCRVALWIEAVEPGRPLSFIESRIRTGDSLVGVFDLSALASGIPDEAYKRLTGDERETCSYYRKLNKKQRDGVDRQQRLSFSGPPAELTEAWTKIEGISDHNLENIQQKSEAYSRLKSTAVWTGLKAACDLWTAAFFVPKAVLPPSDEAPYVPLTDHVWLACQGTKLPVKLSSDVNNIAQQAHFFHWQLEFPEVFERGGFDIVLGNPPWEVSEFDEIEFFSSRAPDIAGLAGNQRKIAISALQTESPRLWQDYQIQKRSSDAVNEFYRASGRFPLTARGKANTYALFSEHFARLTSLLRDEKDPQAATQSASSNHSAGIIVPTGISTDDSTSDFFAALIAQRRLRRLVSFYEVRAWFPATDDRNPFALVSMGASPEDPSMIFDAKTVADASDRRKAFRLSASDLKLFNPNTRTAPTFRSEHDADLTRRIYEKTPVLNDQGSASNPWGVSFKQGLFNMTSDSGLFRTAAQLSDAGGRRRGPEWHLPATSEAAGVRPGTWLPLVEGKTIDHYDHRYGTYAGFTARPTYSASLPAPTDAQRKDPTFEVDPWYWAHSSDVEEQLANTGWKHQWLCGFRDVTKALNERTVILSSFPRWAVGHTLPILFCDTARVPVAVLIAGLSSLPFDYFARQKLNGPHLTFTYLRQFPFPSPDQFTEAERGFVTSRVIELAYTSNLMRPFAEDLGYTGSPFAWNEDRRALLKAELDAFFATKFDLSVDDLQYVLDPARSKGDDYPSETFRVLKVNEVAQHGEYRTARLVLDAFDRLKKKLTPASETMAAPSTIRSAPAQLDALGPIPDLAWQRPNDGADAMLTQLVALLANLAGPTPIEKVFLATIYSWQPNYLSRRISGADLNEWTRLTGEPINTAGKNVAFLTPKTDVAFRDAVMQLRGMRALIEDPAAMTWQAGPGLAKFDVDEDSWASGRARFALSILAQTEIEQAVSGLHEADVKWVKNAHAA
ncbi:Eco57I restriction-modification methylase domain-containing protein [Bradyrhizobium sp. CIR3A]|uniref:Eco57I restriction-modification methylase domain-containing protein n=1 Tax=Bradyrhizobium sp. CIR3A TaxID=2663838 RepID=UPI001605C9D0|nr:N-6 DNA methylase [Bradyrhizobium sp. CIR3A]MBB4263751.1 hypothetical protein [Bradyrhizobium sp. CIR3A]